METLNHTTPVLETSKPTSLPELLDKLQTICRNCKPLTPITCLTDCRTWKIKNQFRKIHGKMQKPNYKERLLNTLKNNRRLELLAMVSKESCSAFMLQQRFKSKGFNHSQQTIVEEYVRPLVETGLLQDGQNPYHTTVLGSRVNELLKNFGNLESMLSSHSECYEERILNVLTSGPKTYSEISAEIPARSAARVLSRLHKAELAETSKDKNYVFFFRSRRDVHLEKISQTEGRIYQNIPEEGISAGKLSERAKISLRKTYKYLRRLKGKKLIFARKKPLTYSLTAKGNRLACMLKALFNLVVETQVATEQLLQDKETGRPVTSQTPSQTRTLEQTPAKKA